MRRGTLDAAAAVALGKEAGDRAFVLRAFKLLVRAWRANPEEVAVWSDYICRRVEPALIWLEEGPKDEEMEEVLAGGREVLAEVKATMDKKAKAGFEAGLKSPAEPGEKRPKADESDEKAK